MHQIFQKNIPKTSRKCKKTKFLCVNCHKTFVKDFTEESIAEPCPLCGVNDDLIYFEKTTDVPIGIYKTGYPDYFDRANKALQVFKGETKNG